MSDREMASDAKRYVLGKMYLVNTVLILCHLGFAYIYIHYQMTVLFFTNFINIGTCLLAFACLKKRMLQQYVHLLFYELYAFMILSIVFLGWTLGFQHYCISFTVAIFFCDFYLHKNETASKKTLAMGLFNMLLYLGLRLWTYFFPHIYSFGNPTLEKGIYILNSVLTFFFVLLYMFIYSSTVNKLENELRKRAERDHTPDRNTFTVCRWGGEEFIVLYIYNGPRDEVINDFDSVRKEVENLSIPYEDKLINVTITIGLTFFRKGISLDDLLKEVDMLLYKGKEAGRNRLMHISE